MASATLKNLSQVPRYDVVDASNESTRFQRGNLNEARANRRQVRDYNELRRAKSSLHSMARSHASPRQVYNNWKEYEAANPEGLDGSVWAHNWSQRPQKKVDSTKTEESNLGFDLVDTYRYQFKANETF